MNKCVGCGKNLQSENVNALGYVPKHILSKNEKDIICQRCFKIKHYNIEALEKKDAFKKIDNILNKNALFVFVCDCLNFDIMFFKEIFKEKNQQVVFVINKADIYSKALKLSKLEEEFYHILKNSDKNIIDFILVSALKGFGIPELKEVLKKYANERDIYFIGTVSSGKSTLINKINGDNQLTTSKSPGTTLEIIKTKKKSLRIFDTPGLINPKEITNYLERKNLDKINISKAFKPKVYQLKDVQTIFIEDFLSVSFFSGENSSVVFYLSQALKYHRTKYSNSETQKKAILNERYEFQEIKINSCSQKWKLEIFGLGFIRVFAVDKIIICLPKHVGVKIINEGDN